MIGNGLFLLRVEPFDFRFNFLEVWRTDHRFESDARTGFVDHVDRFVGQTPRRDVAGRKFDRLGKRVVGDLNAVMLLVPLAETFENLNRLRR